jgi:NAD(P)-dependent dehydrogenase (short-subunit alcohol dehydrogenase family)
MIPIMWCFTQTFCTPSFVPKRDLPSLDGKVAIVSQLLLLFLPFHKINFCPKVTGASAGLGAETSLQLAQKGAHVFCMGRSKDKTTAVIDKIIQETGNSKVEFLQADLMDLKSVENAADAFLAKRLPLHILVNNAGIMACPYALSKDGIESQMATNHFAHAVLTNRLVPAIKKAGTARIVNLSSEAHQWGAGIEYDKLNDEKRYSAVRRYAETKMANIHFTTELQKRFDAITGVTVFCNSCHPGVVATELSRSLGDSFGTGTSFTTALYNFVSIDAKRGALNQIYLAASKEVEEKDIRRKYFVPYLSEITPSSTAGNEEMAAKTWTWTETVLKEFYDPKWTWKL